MSSTLRPAVAAALLAAVVAAAGCGGSAPPDTPVRTVAASLPLHPRPAAPTLVQVDLVGEQLGAHDTITYATDGSATIVKAYGGGGYVTERCTLDPAIVRALRRAVADLPVDEPAPRPSRRRPKGFYVPHPYFNVTRAGRTDSFLADAMPADGAPLARHATRLLHGVEGRCTRDLQRFHAG